MSPATRKELEEAITDPNSDAVTVEAAEVQRQKGIFAGVKEVVREFFDDDGMTQAAALAFYTGLSIAPLLTITVWITQSVLGQSSKDQIVQVFIEVVGKQAGEPIRQLIDPASAQASAGMTVTGLISIGFLMFTASGVFSQLQASLNIMWNVEAKAQGSGVWLLVRKRLFSFGMLLTILFLLMVSMLLSVAIEAIFGKLRAEHGVIYSSLNLGVTFAVATGLFALMFAYLPDARVPWKDTFVGAGITAVLFLVGRYVLALYLGRGGYETSYGAAIGSFVALLVWVYYTSIIIFIGTEATQVYARRQGDRVTPEEHAVKTKRIKREVPS